MEFAAGNLFFRRGEIESAGTALEGHEHNFDHCTFCLSGRLRVDRTAPDGTRDSVELVAGMLPLLIKAECHHTLVALAEDTSYLCIYAHRTPQGDVVQQYTGWSRAYL